MSTMGIMREYTICKSCLADIFWCVSEKGNRIPVDKDPVVGGNLRIIPNPIPNARVQPDIDLFDEHDDGVRYLSHFVTCPNADEHRAKKKAK